MSMTGIFLFLVYNFWMMFSIRAYERAGALPQPLKPKDVSYAGQPDRIYEMAVPKLEKSLLIFSIQLFY